MRRLMIGLGVALGCAVAPALAQTAAPDCPWTDDTWTDLSGGWSRYGNGRFGTTADVPRHLFKPVEPEPANGDGRLFKAKDGAEMTISASYAPDALGMTFGAYKDWLLEHADLERLTYKQGGQTWIVYSGVEGKRIIYRKAVEGCGAAHEFSIAYPAAKKAFYDPIIARIAHSLSCRKSRC